MIRFQEAVIAALYATFNAAGDEHPCLFRVVENEWTGNSYIVRYVPGLRGPRKLDSHGMPLEDRWTLTPPLPAEVPENMRFTFLSKGLLYYAYRHEVTPHGVLVPMTESLFMEVLQHSKYGMCGSFSAITPILDVLHGVPHDEIAVFVTKKTLEFVVNLCSSGPSVVLRHPMLRPALLDPGARSKWPALPPEILCEQRAWSPERAAFLCAVAVFCNMDK